MPHAGIDEAPNASIQAEFPRSAEREALNWNQAADDSPVRSGVGWEGRIEGFCPVQGHGVVDGRGWYFRARHDAWSFEVWESGPLPSDGHGGYRLPTESADWWLEGDDDDASWMRFSAAWGLIESGIAAWRTRPAASEARP